MRLPRFIALLLALFAVSYLVAFFLTRRAATAAPQRVAQEELKVEEPGPVAQRFEDTADRVTLGSGIEPDPRTGALATFDGMLRRMASLPDGAEKMELAQAIGAIRDRAAAPVLLDWAVVTNDRALLRSALDALGPLTDAELIAEIQRRYAAAFRHDDKYRLARILRNITNPDTVPVLIALAEDPATPEPLTVAATDALATLGTPAAVSLLLGKLEVAAPDDTGRLTTVLARVSTPEARPALQYAALGNKEASTDRTRVAAIQALANFRDEETTSVLERLSADPAAAIRDAARDVLARVR